MAQGVDLIVLTTLAVGLVASCGGRPLILPATISSYFASVVTPVFGVR